MTRIIQFTRFLLSLLLTFSLIAYFPSIRVQAQSQLNGNPELRTSRLAYEPPADIGKPGRREGAGTRSPCFEGQTLPTALVPDQPMAFGMTATKYPTFFVYVPPIYPTQRTKMEFALTDENGEEIYTTAFRMTEHSGIVSVNLPAYANLPPLEIDKNYQWSFSIFCAAKDAETETELAQTAQFFLNGWLRRIELNSNLVDRLKEATPRDRISLYAKNGVWFDALAELAELRRAKPNDTSLTADWVALLESVKLYPDTIPPKSLLPGS